MVGVAVTDGSRGSCISALGQVSILFRLSLQHCVLQKVSLRLDSSGACCLQNFWAHGLGFQESVSDSNTCVGLAAVPNVD